MRAPGGEPALVTRLTQGQLWFSAGRRRSPWRHEVHVGPAIVSTPRGRFQAVAEADGGATISCLAGRTRVVAGLREPVLLGPDQSAAVSSDGRTLVVMDRATDGAGTPPEVVDLTDDVDVDLVAEEAAPAAVVAELATVGAPEAAGPAPRRLPEGPAGDGGAGGEDEGDVVAPEEPTGRSARLGWIPELVAVLALVGVLVAIVWVFVSGDDGTETAAPTTPAPVEQVTPTAAPTTPTTTEATEIGEPATTQVSTTVPTTVTTLPPLAAGASASGELAGCRRADGGVTATVAVTHRGGPASSFDVKATLVDANGSSFAEGTQRSPLLQPGTSTNVDVLVPFEGRPEGACELVSVTGG